MQALPSVLVHALKGTEDESCTLERGRVVQSNFHDFPLLRFDEMPEVDVHILESGAEIGGIGEVGTPPIASAVANAVYAATGQRLRKLPLRLS